MIISLLSFKSHTILYFVLIENMSFAPFIPLIVAPKAEEFHWPGSAGRWSEETNGKRYDVAPSVLAQSSSQGPSHPSDILRMQGRQVQLALFATVNRGPGNQVPVQSPSAR